MSRIIRRICCRFFVAAAALLLATSASAVSLPTRYVDAGTCDSHPTGTILSHELGAGTAFPIDERISVSTSLTGSLACVAQDFSTLNDFEVTITNLSSTAYQNLFFVADPDIPVGNADGSIEEIAFSGTFGEAFRIDSAGVNANLTLDAGNDGIFSPGETWVFLLTNFSIASLAPPAFDDVGVAGGSGPLSNASIVADPIPEPATGLLFGFGLAGIGLRRRRARIQRQQ